MSNLETPVPPEPGSAGWGALGLYALPTLALTAPAFFVQFYFLAFATDALLLAPATVGVLLAGSRIWDAISDPLAGYASDRTRTRWGRRRPWLALAAPASAVAFFALWNPPRALDTPTALAVWCALALLLFTTAATAWAIPHQALGAELSRDTHARTRLFGLRFAASLWGVALSFVAMQSVGTAEDPRAMASRLSVFAALAMTGCLIVPAVGLRERAAGPNPSTSSPWRATREIVASRTARRLLAIWFAAQLGMSAQGVIAPYMSTYVMRRPDLMGVLPALFITPLILSIPLWVHLAGRFGRRRVWLASMLGASVSYALLFLLPPDDVWVTGLLLGTAGFWTGCGGPIGPSFFASLVDAEAQRTGERREGTTFAAKEFVEKASGAAVTLVVGVVLQLTGFEPHATQSEAVQLAIRGCLGLLPGTMLLVAALLLRGLPLGDSDGERSPAPVG